MTLYYFLHMCHLAAIGTNYNSTHHYIQAQNELFYASSVIFPVIAAQPQPAKFPPINNKEMCVYLLVGAWLSAANECL